MELKVIRIDGEFVIVELANGVQKICPTAIFPAGFKEDDIVVVTVKDK
ncbi:MAG: hypothetical protein IKK18_00785 [Clostridia bacterium]|nr:hypothetical protein [Clostridia bacterium]